MSTENRKSSRTRLGGSNLETTAVDQETLDRNAEVIEAVLTASQETELLGILQEINFGNDQVDKLGHLLTPAKSKLVTVQFQDLTSKLTLGLVTVMAYIRGGTSSYKYCRKMCWGSAHNHTATNWQRTALALLPKVFTSAFVDVDGLAAALKAAEEGEKPKDWLGKFTTIRLFAQDTPIKPSL